MKNDKQYWLTVFPYVHIKIAKDNALLYNTLSAKTIRVENPCVLSCIKELNKPENMMVTGIYTHDINYDIKDFIANIRELFMGDLIPAEISLEKPVQIIPLYDIQEEVTRLKKEGKIAPVGKGVVSYLKKINIILNNNGIVITPETIKKLLHQLPPGKSVSVQGNLSSISENSPIIEALKCYNTENITLILNNITRNGISKIPTGYNITMPVKFPTEENSIKQAITLLKNYNPDFGITFSITSYNDMEIAENMINKYDIKKYKFKPEYNEANRSFFEENVFITEKDILAYPVSMREIYAHQLLNTFNFGKITMLPNGDIHANTHFPSIGNINSESLPEILNSEMDKGNSWLRIRDKEPCQNCLYQWICPSPSDYEIETGRPNLCNIKV